MELEIIVVDSIILYEYCVCSYITYVHLYRISVGYCKKLSSGLTQLRKIMDIKNGLNPKGIKDKLKIKKFCTKIYFA